MLAISAIQAIQYLADVVRYVIYPSFVTPFAEKSARGAFRQLSNKRRGPSITPRNNSLGNQSTT
jgi:hypothetical protein